MVTCKISDEWRKNIAFLGQGTSASISEFCTILVCTILHITFFFRPWQKVASVNYRHSSLKSRLVYNCNVEYDAHVVFRGVTGGERTARRVSITQEMFNIAVTPVLRPMFDLPLVAFIWGKKAYSAVLRLHFLVFFFQISNVWILLPVSASCCLMSY